MSGLGLGLALGLGSGPDRIPYHYYIDAVTGDDGNDGLTPATAWASLSKIDANIVESGATVRVLVKSGTYDTADDYVAVETAATALAANTVLDVTCEPGCIMDGTAVNAVASTNGFELSGDNEWDFILHGNGLQINNYKDAAGPTSPNGIGNRGRNRAWCYDFVVDGAEDGISSHGDAKLHVERFTVRNCTKTPIAHVDNAEVTHIDGTIEVTGTNIGGVQGDSATATYTRCTFIPDQSGRTIDVRNSTFTRCKLGTPSLSLTVNGTVGTNSIDHSFINLYVDGDRRLNLTHWFGKLTIRVRPGGEQIVEHGTVSGPATGQGSVILGTSDLSGAQTLVFKDNIAETATAAAFMNVNATTAGYLVAEDAEFFNNCLSGSAAYDADLIAADSGGTVIVDTVSADALIGAANTMVMADYAYGDGSPCIGAGTGGGNIGFGAADVVDVGVAA